MPKYARRIIPLFLCLIVAFSSVSASANVVGDLVDNIWSFWDSCLEVAQLKPMRDWLNGLLGGSGSSGQVTTPEQAQETYNQYVTNLQNNYNTTNINAGGYSYFYPTGWTYKNCDSNYPTLGNSFVDERFTFFNTSTATCSANFFVSEQILGNDAPHIVAETASFSLFLPAQKQIE